MSEKQHISFTTAIEHAAAYTPGKVFDVRSDATGDTMLTQTSIEAAEGIEAAEIGLREYLTTADEEEYTSIAIVRQRLAEVALIQAVVGQVTGEVDRSQEIHGIQQELYVHYSPTLFGAALRQKIELLEATTVPGEIEIGKALLLDQLEGYAASLESGSQREILAQPTEETLTVVGAWLRDQFEDIFEEIDALPDDTLNSAQLSEIMNMAIATTPALQKNSWRANVKRRNKTAVSVFASDRSVVIPEQRRTPKNVAKKLIVHEVFGHALRSGMAEAQGNIVGTTGTASYSQFEESFEIALEQCLEGAYDPKRGIDHYVSIGMAETLGLPREKIAQLTVAMRQITLAGNDLTPDKIAKANTLAQSQMGRTFAGFTDVDDGIAHRKDINYLHGLNGAWKLLNAIVKAEQVDEGMRWLLSAKFNPYDEHDRRHMEQYGAMPSSIKEALGV